MISDILFFILLAIVIVPFIVAVIKVYLKFWVDVIQEIKHFLIWLFVRDVSLSNAVLTSFELWDY
jgi:hypothetical protein